MVRVQRPSGVTEIIEAADAHVAYEQAIADGMPAWEYDNDGNCLRNTLGIPVATPVTPTVVKAEAVTHDSATLICPHCGSKLEVKADV